MNIKKLFSFLGSKKVEPSPVDKKSSSPIGGQSQILLQDGDFLNFALGYGGGLTGYESLSNAQAMDFYRQSSSVATAVDIRAQEIERIMPVIELPDGTLTDTHPILDLLKNPNDWNETYSSFIGGIARASMLTGDDYVYASGIITNPPLELYATKPQNVNTEAGNMDQRPTAYTIYNGDGRGNYARTRGKTGFRFYDGNLKELWHTQGYSSTTSNLSGDSNLTAIALDIYSQVKGLIHNTKLLDNGARPSLLVAFKDTMTQDQHDERRQLINEQLAGSDNAGKIGVISSSDMEMKELGISNKDMDYVKLAEMADQAINRRYRIPLPFTTSTAMTDNNMAHAVYQLYDFAVLPQIESIFASLTMFLMPRFGLSPEEFKITYNPDDIEALKQRRIDTLQKRRTLNIETTNELREGLPNRDDVDGGDVILVSSATIPINEASIAEKPETITPEKQAQALIDRDT